MGRPPAKDPRRQPSKLSFIRTTERTLMPVGLHHCLPCHRHDSWRAAVAGTTAEKRSSTLSERHRLAAWPLTNLSGHRDAHVAMLAMSALLEAG